jgi:hypothetical protein
MEENTMDKMSKFLKTKRMSGMKKIGSMPEKKIFGGTKKLNIKIGNVKMDKLKYPKQLK